MSRANSSKGPSQRQLRAGELIRHALADILGRGLVRNPAVATLTLTVTEVRVSPDLKQATAFVTPLGGEGRAAAVAALNRAAGEIRRQLAAAVELKFTPALVFRADESFDAARRVDEILARPDVARDLARDHGGEGEA